MTSGYSTGGTGFYGGIDDRSVANADAISINQPTAPNRTQIPGIFMDTTSQIVNGAAPSLIGKRTLADFVKQQLQYSHTGRNNLYLRSVKPRTNYQHSSLISPLSSIGTFSSNLSSEVMGNFSSPTFISQRYYGLPLLQQPRSQQISVGITSGDLIQGVHQMSPIQTWVVQQQDPEKKMMNQLQELEKQLLDDENDEEGDAVSVITNTKSEWSEAIQNLISSGSPINPVAPSPTSSTSSSSSSTSSVASPAAACPKQTIMEAASAISEGKTDAANEILTRLARIGNAKGNSEQRLTACMLPALKSRVNPVEKAASAISEGKTDAANEILTRLARIGNAKGNSEQRLMACMLPALKSRVNPVENPPPVAELFSKEHATATQLLYDLSPCFKLGFLAANLAILDTISEQPNCNKFHVIDFDIGQGGQYINLLHALSERGNGKPTMVKITAITDNSGDDKLKMVGNTLSQIAQQFGICMKFNVVTSLKLSDLSRESLGCEPEVPLAINFAFRLYRMPDESVCVENPRDELLRRVKGLSPRVVTLVEQEMNTSTAPFAPRVGEVSAYYGALFESIESTVWRENSERATLEEGLCRKIANSVSCEGRDRVERCEVFGKWRARMSMAGFELKLLSQSVAESMRDRLNSGNRIDRRFTVREGNGAVCFGWMSRTLTVASARH